MDEKGLLLQSIILLGVGRVLKDYLVRVRVLICLLLLNLSHKLPGAWSLVVTVSVSQRLDSLVDHEEVRVIDLSMPSQLHRFCERLVVNLLC